ncbi:MAG: toll/interleukin-1 receptor domain-containing protein [Deltaproteobacteria bacterium]|nr:toll/interleukin-1 receptor domain-containing protein [Deltaproteobacteria bacterium]
MSIATAFLSHSSKDKPLVRNVANALCQRGVIPWLDEYNLSVGIDLETSFKQAITDQAALVLFLSQAALESGWVRKELEHAIQLEQQGDSAILPIFLGDPLSLINSSELLQRYWLDSSGQLVNRLGVTFQEIVAAESPAVYIANRLAGSLYKKLAFKDADNQTINIAIDQRGEGERIGECFHLLSKDSAQKVPTLVFRPDTGTRHRWDTMTEDIWQGFCQNLKKSLVDVIGTPRGKEIHLFGNAQLGIAYFLGQHFDRATGATLSCHNLRVKPPTTFTNEKQSHWGGESQASLPPYKMFLKQGTELYPGKLDPFQKYPKLSLYIGNTKYLPDVEAHLMYHTPELPLAVVQTEYFYHSDEVMTFVEQIVTLLQYFRYKSGFATKTARLYTGLPFNVVALLTASLTHEIDIEFMEYRYDRKVQGCAPHELYTYLPMYFGDS